MLHLWEWTKPMLGSGEIFLSKKTLSKLQKGNFKRTNLESGLKISFREEVNFFIKIFTQSVSSPLTNVYDATKIPFAFISQYLLAEKLLIVHHSTLHKISEAMIGLEGDCVLIHNTARCGSTLLCQVSF